MRSTGLPLWIERFLGLSPIPVPPDIFWITASELRVARFSRRSRKGLELLELYGTQLPAGTLEGGPLGGRVLEPRSLEQAIRSLLARVARPIKEASLVVPEAWVRQLLLEVENLPRTEPGRTEAIRFRLKKIVPYRLEELRIVSRRVPRLPGDSVDTWLIGMGSEPLLAALENSFGAAQVRIGQLVGAGAAAAVALLGRALEPLVGMLWVEPDCLLLVVSRHGVPVLWRQKLFTADLDASLLESLLLQELCVTAGYLRARFPNESLAWVGLVAPAEVVPFWSGVLSSGLEVPVRTVQWSDLGFEATPYGLTAAGLAPMLGAALEEVAV